MKQGSIFHEQDIWAGLLFIGFGLVGVAGGWLYPVGTAVDMGPGYFPFGIGIGLLVCGTAIFARGLMRPGRDVPAWAIRPLLMIAAAIVCFSWAIDSLGFVLAALLLILLACLAHRPFSLREFVGLCVVLIGGGVLIFIKALSLSMKVLP
ncbi:tripartite tricarboxylate transporter TctB family protein [Xanthobacter tagetidis]|jgi:hypothetical protein|uniref:Tripartite tricarboxylate transporter TctB family protein n=1 Tax=Xanthobacter tagetidis TaxID=60216 RepID=A0A3L7A5I7_9HYPH|nr:tripartite tricarboxylate transporter TctB family protein [Xanthobacter tagetidis]MBB6310005.1 hypothetical protein [Xanthobacter tagetidis]RLP75110.1 tripartite tricarboxylate transporter TctB family protein [Xanthobacter tagetidis]